MEIKRDVYLNRLAVRRQNGFIKIITGIRRSGKSYLLNVLFYNYLRSTGVDERHIVRFAFDSADDLRLIGENYREIDRKGSLVDPDKFMDYISSKTEGDGTFYLLLDEVQKLDGFESVLNGYLRKPNLDVYVTGSNSRFLSSDVITEFAGRGDEVHVLPLSFSEFFGAFEGSADEAYDEYSVYGGLPAIALMQTEEQKASYLLTQMQNVYLRDIVNRYNLHSESEIGDLVNILASGIASLTSPTKLADTFKTVLPGSSICATTVDRYIDYLKDAFLISKTQRYDIKGKRYIGSPYKIYFEDLGLRNARLNFRQIEQTHIMENVIYNELRYRGFSVDVGTVEIRGKSAAGKEEKKQVEIDFVANQGSKKYYVQSAYAIPTPDKMEHETRPFDKIGDSFKKILLVSERMKPRRTEKGYVMMGVKEFLLDPNSLDA